MGHDPDAAWLWEPVKLNQMVRRHNSKIVINPRSGWEGDFYCDEGSHEIMGKIVPVPWEKNLCICSGTSWGWIPDDPVMSFPDIIRMLINVFVRDGNVLLNVGPDRDGVIPSGAVARLKEVGRWMQRNGESIYGTRGGPFQPVDRVFGSTCSGKNVYMHIQDCDELEKLVLPAINRKIVNCTNLTGGDVVFSQNENGITISVKPEHRDPVDTIIKLELDSEIAAPHAEDITFTA